METTFDNLGLSVGYNGSEGYWNIAYDIYGHGDFNFCSKAVSDYIIRKIRKFPAESWRKNGSAYMELD